MSVQKINPDAYVGDTGIQLKDLVEINNYIKSLMAMAAVACYRFSGSGSTDYISGSYIPFTTKVFNAFDNQASPFNNVVSPNSDGTITINYTGWIEVSVNLWLYSGSNVMRPWVKVGIYNGGEYGESITSNSSYYQTVHINKCLIPVTSGQKIYVRVYTNNGTTCRVNAGSGNTIASWIHIKLA